MVLCFIALPVLAVLGIFSVKYRMLAKEAFRCLFNTIRLRPCDTGFDQRIKSKVTAKLIKWPWLARPIYRHFTAFSWIFVLLMVLSTFFAARGFYYYYLYGNCNGPNSSAFCPIAKLNIVRPEQSAQEGVCPAGGSSDKLLPENIMVIGDPIRGKPDAKVTLIEYGCYSCPFTKEAEPVIRRVMQENPEVSLIYHDVPLSIHNNSVEAALASRCADEQGKYWQYHDLIFDNQERLDNSTLRELASGLSLNMTQFDECYQSGKYQKAVDASYAQAMKVGIYGTPTFFINNRSIVGPKDLYNELKSAIRAEEQG